MSKRLRFTLLGHPVAHSISPAICTAAFSELNLPHIYGVLDVPTKTALRLALNDLRTGIIAGANVTLPHKRTVLEMVDAKDESAEEVGAANVLVVGAKRRIIAYNTDADALTAELSKLLAGRPKLRAAVIGAGGAALAALVACKRLGFSVMCVTSRSWTDSERMFASPAAERARALGALTSLWPVSSEAQTTSKGSQVLRLQWRELAAQADCIIQATSAGMAGADPGHALCDVVPWDRLPSHTLVYDVVYTPRITPFMEKARAHGFRIVGGLGMLARQAQLAVRLWTGEEPPLDVMRAAAEAALAPEERRESGSMPPQDTLIDEEPAEEWSADGACGGEEEEDGE
jgi:shikimate dehydrogenase